MKKTAVVLALAVAFSYLTVSSVQADALTAGQAAKYMNNSLKAAALPVWKITQDGTVDSVPWVDATNPRFAVYDSGIPGVPGDDLVLDKETGLVWKRHTTSTGNHDWEQATLCSRGVSLGNRRGWRLPTVEELSSLLDMSGPGTDGTMLPEGHPFLNVQLEDKYWSSTTRETDSSLAWAVDMSDGVPYIAPKTNVYYTWSVRGGNGYATGNW